MAKELHLVWVRPYGKVVRFVNRIDGAVLAEIELTPRASYTQNVDCIFKVAGAVEDYVEGLVDRSLPVSAYHRVLTAVTYVNVTPFVKTLHIIKGGRIVGRLFEYRVADVMNNLSFENQVAAFYEEYYLSVKKSYEKKEKSRLQLCAKPDKKGGNA